MEANELIGSREIQNLQRQNTDLVATATVLTISDDEAAMVASAVLSNVANTKKTMEKQRVFFTAPLNEQVKKINELFKSLSKPLDDADKILRDKVGTYQAQKREESRRLQEEVDRQARELQEQLRKEREAEQAQLDKMAEAAGVEAPRLDVPTVTAPVFAPPQVKFGATSTRKVWTFEVVDALSVPRAYLDVNETRIRSAVNSGVREIAGVRIFEKEQVVVR